MSTSMAPRSAPGLRRARFAGALALLLAFAIGFASAWLVLRDRSSGLQVTVTATDELPDELVRLDLSGEQRSQAEAAIRRGRDRVLRVVDAFDPTMRAAIDSTDAEIRAILTESQRAAFDAARAANRPPLRRTYMKRP